MCSACIPIFVGRASPVSEIFLFSNLTIFPSNHGPIFVGGASPISEIFLF